MSKIDLDLDTRKMINFENLDINEKTEISI